MAAPNSSLTAFSADVASLATQASQCTVALRNRGHAFSGFYWRPDVIATAAELVSTRPGDKISVLTPSHETVEGVVIGRDPSTDVALVRAPATARRGERALKATAGHAIGHCPRASLISGTT